jgi:hypothetical protein
VLAVAHFSRPQHAPFGSPSATEGSPAQLAGIALRLDSASHRVLPAFPVVSKRTHYWLREAEDSRRGVGVIGPCRNGRCDSGERPSAARRARVKSLYRVRSLAYRCQRLFAVAVGRDRAFAEGRPKPGGASAVLVAVSSVAGPSEPTRASAGPGRRDARHPWRSGPIDPDRIGRDGLGGSDGPARAAGIVVPRVEPIRRPPAH